MLDDEEMILRMRRGDQSGLEALLRHHGPRIKRALSVMTKLHAGDARLEEAVHDAALVLWHRAERLDAAKNLAGYFGMTARHILLKSLASPNGARETQNGSLADVAASVSSDGAASISDFSRQLEQIFADLSDLERGVCALDLIHNCSMPADEMARELRTSRDTIYSTRLRIKKRLQGFLDRWRRERGESP